MTLPATSQRRSLVAPAALTTGFTVVAAATSAVNLAIITALFGTSKDYGYYLAASRLPNLLMLVLAAAIPSTLLPVFTQLEVRDGHDAAWLMASRLIAAVVLSLAVLTVMLFLLAPLLIGGGILTPGADFAPPGRGYTLTTLMLRIQLPNLILAGVAGTLTGLHLAHHSFVRPAAAPVIQAAGMLATILILRPLMHPSQGILALAIGSVIGPLLQVLILTNVLARGYHFTLNPRHPDVKRLAGRTSPLMLARFAAQGSDLIETRVASTIPQALPVLGLASLLSDRLTNVISQGVAVTTFPDLTRHAAADDATSFRARFSITMRFMLLVVIPATLALFLLRERLIAMLFMRGKFTPLDTAQVGLAFAGYLGALFATAVGKVATNALYAQQRIRVLTFVSLAGTGLYIVLANVLPGLMRPPYIGLAVGWSITTTANLALTLFLLRRQSGRLDGRRILVSGSRMLLAAAAMGVVIMVLDGLVSGWILAQPDLVRTLALAVELTGLAAIGSLVYMAGLRLVGATELDGFLAAMRRLLPSRRPAAA